MIYLGLVDEHALTRALTAATNHIEVNLFSGDANRLFESLTAKLADPLLVNSVFTSIYLFGALAAELSSSLPNYKDTYIPVDRMLVHQLFLAAIGDGAFRENRSANLDAFQTLAYTAGLLRPTDIGYSTFPGFPSLQPSTYSSRSFSDVRNNRSVYEKLVRHFDRYGFPQPSPQRQAQVGAIRDWRFLHGESHSKSFEVERADKNIGENFGRVLHWLVCSADRMPPGQAVIAYHDQHIELIKWIGGRMGFVILAPAVDLIMTGNHAAMDTRLRATLNNWVILMSCEQAKLARQASINKWVEDRERAAQQIRKMQASQNAASQAQNTANVQRKPSVASSPPHAGQQPYQPSTRPPNTTSPPPAQQPYQPSTRPPNTASPPPAQQPYQPSAGSPNRTSTRPPSTMAMPQPIQSSVVEQFNTINNWFNTGLKPQCQALLRAPPPDRKALEAERTRLIHLAEHEVIYKLDALQIPEGTQGREKRKAVIMQAQSMVSALEAVGAPRVSPALSSQSRPAFVPLPSAEIDKPSTPSNPAASVAVQHPAGGSISDAKPPLIGSTAEVSSPPSTSSLTSPTISPPPYSPGTSPAGSTSTATSGFPFHEKRNTVIRRRAPPPPRTARALFDFEPDEEEDNDDELAFKEGEILEITSKSADLEAEGWCKARIKGTRKVGLAPLEYLEMIAPAPQPSSHTSAPGASAGPSQATNASISKPTGPSQPPIGIAPHTAPGPQLPQNVPHSSMEANISVQNQPSVLGSITNPSKPPITHATSSHNYAPTFNYAPATSNVSGSAAEYYQISSGAPAQPPAAAINNSAIATSSQNAASSLGVQGSSAPGPGTQNASPLTNPSHTGPVEVKNKMGKLEKAGLGLAAVGAAAGVANVIQDAQQPSETHTQTQTVQKQQQPDADQDGGNGNGNSQNQGQTSNDGDLSSSNAPNNSGGADQSKEHQGQASNDDSNNSNQATQPSNRESDQNTTDQPSQASNGQSQDGSSQHDANNAYSNYNNPRDDDTYTTTTNTTTTNNNNTYFSDPLLPPSTDLSAFGGGFEPYTDTTPLAPITSTDPYFDPAFISASDFTSPPPPVGDESMASFDAPATTSPFAASAASPFAAGVPVDDAAGMMSPFASMAAPSTGGYQEVDESTVVVSSQQEWDGSTSWEATEVDDFSF